MCYSTQRQTLTLKIRLVSKEFDCGNIINVCLLSLQRGRTPLHLASDNGQTEVVKIFSAASNTNNDAVDDVSLNKVHLILYNYFYSIIRLHCIWLLTKGTQV